MKTTTDAVFALLPPGTDWYMRNNDLTTLVINTPGVSAPLQSDVDNWLSSH